MTTKNKTCYVSDTAVKEPQRTGGSAPQAHARSGLVYRPSAPGRDAVQPALCTADPFSSSTSSADVTSSETLPAESS